MEEVDSILIYTLKQIGCDVDSKVEALSPTQIIRCVSRCFELIRPDLQIPAYDGNTSMSARYKLASQISQAIMDLGYKEEVGCQTFLYPTENDTRKLLIFMMEKLPKGLDSEVGNNIQALMSRITKKEEENDNNNELPVSNGVEVSGIRLPTAVDVDSLPKETLRFYASHLADLTFAKQRAKFKKPDGEQEVTVPTPIPRKPQMPSLDDDDDFGDPDDNVISPSVVELEQVQIIEQTKPKIPDKPKPSVTKPKPALKQKPKLLSAASTEDEEEQKKRVEDERLAAEAIEKIKSIQEEVKSKAFHLHSSEVSLSALSQSITSSEEEVLRLEAELNKREKDIERQRKAAQLLNSSTDGLEKVRRAVEAQLEKILNLAEQWETHRKPLVEEIQKKSDAANLSETLKQKEEIRNLKTKLKEMGQEAKSKEESYGALLAEFERMPKDLNRSAYMKRIIEIIGNIKKQRKEITKVLTDTKEIQKDINTLSGKLGRTFAVADELLFQDAEKDKNVAQSYKLLVAIHSDFSRIIKVLEDIGNLKRSYRDLEDKLDLEKGKNIEGKLERLKADLAQMKHENQVLQAKLRDPAFQKRPTPAPSSSPPPTAVNN